jgi:hypothetical protein
MTQNCAHFKMGTPQTPQDRDNNGILWRNFVFNFNKITIPCPWGHLPESLKEIWRCDAEREIKRRNLE